MLDASQAHWIIVTWMSLIGAVIGSFLNVVVYRLPLGMSLVEPPSHCPRCKHHIRWFDNVPILGWIMRRGSCRDCGVPISIRYPIVEAITALIFGLMTAYEYVALGKNLPLRSIQRVIEVAPHAIAITRQTGLSQGELFAVLLFHLLLLCTLLCTALIEIDGQRPPLRLFWPTAIIGLIAPVWWPWLRPVPWQVLPPAHAWSAPPHMLVGAVDGLIGLAAGAAIGGVLYVVARGPRKPIGFLLALAAVGLCLGWQAVVGPALAATAVSTVNWVARLGLRRMWQIPATVWLLTFTLIGILFWERIATLT
jgi:leader peptidase (prepilin peptidase) / N-methyltransferase